MPVHEQGSVEALQNVVDDGMPHVLVDFLLSRRRIEHPIVGEFKIANFNCGILNLVVDWFELIQRSESAKDFYVAHSKPMVYNKLWETEVKTSHSI